MRVEARKAAPAHKMQAGRALPPTIAEPFTFPAPTNGWTLNENLAAPSPASARKLDNWICTPTGIRVRGGSALYATLDAPVVSMWAYKSGSLERFFAATSASVFDVTSPASPTVVPTASVTGRTSGYYVTEQFSTAGGAYLYAANGTDAPLLYDGTTFTAITGVSSPAITGVTTSTLSFVWSYANRLFFIEKGTMRAHYLPVDSIGGAVAQFSLGGVFKRGGSLLMGATWSLDSGEGLDDKCVFISTEGEIAVYSGTNPGSAADWRLDGVYQITKPLGLKGTMQAGGDLLVASETGLVPVSEAIRRDIAALSLGAVSRRIETYWQERSRLYGTRQWEVLKWPRENLMIVSQPGGGNTCLVANLQTGAWSRFTNWDTNCLGLFASRAFFGTSDNLVVEMEVGASDRGTIYTASYLGQHEPMGAPGRQKTVHQMRALFQSGTAINPQLTCNANFNEDLGAPPDPEVSTPVAGWDISAWDVGLWDQPSGATITATDARWRSIGITGHTIAPQLQISFNSTGMPSVELVSIDATYSIGALVA